MKGETRMDLEAKCTCGHTYEEHRRDHLGVHGCQMPDCDCIMFDEDGDEDPDE